MTQRPWLNESQMVGRLTKQEQQGAETAKEVQVRCADIGEFEVLDDDEK